MFLGTQTNSSLRMKMIGFFGDMGNEIKLALIFLLDERFFAVFLPTFFEIKKIIMITCLFSISLSLYRIIENDSNKVYGCKVSLSSRTEVFMGCTIFGTIFR